jgi:hypothetical protein
VADIEDKTDNKSNIYMTWKSIASRFTMSSESDSKVRSYIYIANKCVIQYSLFKDTCKRKYLAIRYFTFVQVYEVKITVE